MSLKRPGDTRWSSHYGTLVNLIHLYSSIVDVLEYVGENGLDDSIRAEADDVLEIINSFEFVFVLHLMKQILGITHELSQVLQKKDQDIVNAMNLVKVAKSRLQIMREKDWDVLLADVSKFVANMNWMCLTWKMTQELNQRFDEVNTDLVLCMSCFDPRDLFSAFDLEKLLRLARYYPSEFSEVALSELKSQLENFIFDVRIDEKFSQISGISGLAQKMVSTRKHEVFPMVNSLVKLSLILPVATASVERAFSAMKIIKISLPVSEDEE
ncbi:uncharacterized protein LOC121790315 [Salvia splendens]|uniref:uncharacterized protein LOC121790315 n=1 Tax=Salvia splendens TaxID=180675 RepID=UPI001C277DB3|nr:uncharacterized protein LOC121790315 [Salvia splendens]